MELKHRPDEQEWTTQYATGYETLAQVVNADLSQHKKTRHWIWYVYPEFGCETYHSDFIPELFTADDTVAKRWRNLFTKVNNQPPDWFPLPDHRRIKQFRELYGAQIANLVRQPAEGTAPAQFIDATQGAAAFVVGLRWQNDTGDKTISIRSIVSNDVLEVAWADQTEYLCYRIKPIKRGGYAGVQVTIDYDETTRCVFDNLGVEAALVTHNDGETWEKWHIVWHKHGALGPH